MKTELLWLAILGLVLTHKKRREIVAVREGTIVLVDRAAWMAEVPDRIHEAVADGARGADGVLLHVMRRIAPDEDWPPADDRQWREMVRVVAATLRLDPKSTTRNLTVV
jgi:hypothetical protein